MTELIPKLAGVCILWRNIKNNPEVLLIKRGETMEFLPGHHAFPGGRVEKEDWNYYIDGKAEQKIKSAFIGAIRETFEETGYFPSIIDNKQKKDELKKLWYDLHNRKVGFNKIIDFLHLKLNLDDVPFSGPWITPPGLPKRFETYFFFIEWKEEYFKLGNISIDEVESILWNTPKNILQQWHEKKVSLSTPVAYILEQIEYFGIPEVFHNLNIIPWKRDGYSYFHPRAGVHIFPLPCPLDTFFNQVNCVVIGKDEMLIIDPGSGEEQSTKEMIFWLEHFIKMGSKLVGICITHSHIDHIGSAELIAKHFELPIYASPECKGKIPFPIDGILNNGDKIILGKNDIPWIIEVISTPGHTEGHLSFYENTTKTLIAGDIISSEGPVLIDPDDGGSMGKYMDSIGKISTLDIDLIIPGHGVVLFFMPGNKMIKKLIEHRKLREEKIINLIKSGVSSINELLLEAYNDVPKERLHLAKQQLKAHLIDLKEKNIISQQLFDKYLLS
ncbi:MAG TPA: MBL fold metallo-hydrolase [Candidatus Hydrogenedens sp.]|nr:MBL fold metallo-hydrolase [Candidatus Hydrogenedens sp.]HOL21055.1 MBL fold metallo-hydrolase [Candidatus Hydrogenedens sp.]HPP58692.1 MBL fold metallo-hydrolase [Candidatus Hydrogenedens sp.]